MKFENILAFTFALLLVGAVIVGCQPEPVVVTPGPGTYEERTFDIGEDVETLNFKSQAELLNFIKENEGAGYNYMLKGGAVLEAAVERVASDATFGEAIAAPAAVDEGVDFSETNVQVAGVDEADIIKTDGEYIYTVSDRVLFIIKAYPGEDAEIVSRIVFESRPESLFIDGDVLAVFGNLYSDTFFREVGFSPRSGMTYLNMYDVGDKENPELLKEYKFEGSYFRGRMTDGTAYILTTSSPYVRPVPMPLIYDGTTKSEIAVEDIYYFNIQYDDPVFVNIHAIDMQTPSVNSKAIAVEYSQNLYMSDDNIYVTYTERINEWELQKEIVMELLEPKLSQDDKILIEKIKAVDNDVLSRFEKEAKIYAVYEDAASRLTPDEQDELQKKAEELLLEKLEKIKYFEYTVINKVNVNGQTIEPVANGKVPGQILNQFSMDENNDVFRIATTLSPRWSRFEKTSTQSTNNIYTLNSELEILDELEGLAENERIFSTRFIGDRLYMVTFRQVDPFFVIDLSNPSNIKQLGELKIPGFSRYLHPYDKDTIIGIGRDTTEAGSQQGLKISLFDVSDVSNPKEVAKYVTESKYASSTVEYEHKAFLFSKDKNLLVIPAYSYDWREGGESWNGALVFDISKDDIKVRGLIDHGGERYTASVERSLYIEELLYTKSRNLLRINKIEDLESVNRIELSTSVSDIEIY
ncbi:beta-propeller domain-containing protein [Candidatus Woesearchaeota archaeon]|nr:beta-propeller domain-containing protein [Candidatus Woesearchaeota archaeon]